MYIYDIKLFAKMKKNENPYRHTTDEGMGGYR